MPKITGKPSHSDDGALLVKLFSNAAQTVATHEEQQVTSACSWTSALTLKVVIIILTILKGMPESCQ